MADGDEEDAEFWDYHECETGGGDEVLNGNDEDADEGGEGGGSKGKVGVENSRGGSELRKILRQREGEVNYRDAQVPRGTEAPGGARVRKRRRPDFTKKDGRKQFSVSARMKKKARSAAAKQRAKERQIELCKACGVAYEKLEEALSGITALNKARKAKLALVVEDAVQLDDVRIAFTLRRLEALRAYFKEL